VNIADQATMQGLAGAAAGLRQRQLQTAAAVHTAVAAAAGKAVGSCHVQVGFLHTNLKVVLSNMAG
jgi:hypothetical protein